MNLDLYTESQKRAWLVGVLVPQAVVALYFLTDWIAVDVGVLMVAAAGIYGLWGAKD